ncbi:MAG: hypothetical protein V4492_09725 [Chlamydiota bacterium]
MKIYFNGNLNIEQNNALIADPATPEHEKIGAVYQNTLNYLQQNIPVPPSLYEQLGVSPHDPDAVHQMSALISDLATPGLIITPLQSHEHIDQNSGAFLIRKPGEEREVAVFKIGVKRAGTELMVRRFAQLLGLECHMIPGMYCSLTEVAHETLRGAAIELWNGHDCEYIRPRPLMSSSSQALNFSSGSSEDSEESDPPSISIEDLCSSPLSRSPAPVKWHGNAGLSLNQTEDFERDSANTSFTGDEDSEDFVTFTQEPHPTPVKPSALTGWTSSYSSTEETDESSSFTQSEESEEGSSFTNSDGDDTASIGSGSDQGSRPAPVSFDEDPYMLEFMQQFGDAKVTSTPAPLTTSSSTQAMESTMAAVVGIVQPFLYENKEARNEISSIQVMNAAFAALLAVAIGLQDGKPDGIILDARTKLLMLFDVEYCMATKLDLPKDCTKEMVEERIAPLDIPFLAEEIFNQPLSKEQVTVLAKLVSGWNLYDIVSEIANIPILYADPIAEEMPEGARGVNQASAHIKIPGITEDKVNGFFDRWNYNPAGEVNPKKHLLTREQLAVCNTRLKRLQEFIVNKSIYRESFTAADLIYAVDYDGEKIAKALSQHASFSDFYSRFSPSRSSNGSSSPSPSPKSAYLSIGGKFSPMHAAVHFSDSEMNFILHSGSSEDISSFSASTGNLPEASPPLTSKKEEKSLPHNLPTSDPIAIRHPRPTRKNSPGSRGDSVPSSYTASSNGRR